MFIFGSFGLKEHLSCYKGYEEIVFFFFFQLLQGSFDFLKSILDDAIVDIKMIFRFGLPT